jgi:Holliday junction resolvase RusA-like endonuclease
MIDENCVVEFFVPGVPIPEPKEQHAVRNGKVVKYRRTRTTPSQKFPNGRSNGFTEWLAKVREAAKVAMGDMGPIPAGVPVDVFIWFVLPRPASLADPVKHGTAMPTGRPDVSNLYYGIENGIKVPKVKKGKDFYPHALGKEMATKFQGFVYCDDSQVTDLFAAKRYQHYVHDLDLTQEVGACVKVCVHDEGAVLDVCR